jgi:hypothetical protein
MRFGTVGLPGGLEVVFEQESYIKRQTGSAGGPPAVLPSVKMRGRAGGPPALPVKRVELRFNFCDKVRRFHQFNPTAATR